jgi:hypothetical protein
MSPTVIDRLRGLKRGEACLWYRGNLPADIKSSSGLYAKLLTDLHTEVLTLEKQGLIKLSTRKASREVPPKRDGDKPQRVEFLEYTAVRS